MKTKTITLFASVIALSLPIGVISASDRAKQQDQSKQQTQLQDQDQKMIYGWELMTVKERTEHQQKMLSLKTEQERTAYIEEHHKLMQQRAKEKGVMLPDAPMMDGMPMMRGTDPGAGGGQGSGGGKK